MRIASILIAGAFLLAGCGTDRAVTASPVGLVKLEHYFVRNSDGLTDAFTYRVVTSEAEFERVFGTQAAAGTSVRRPDFSGQTVVGVIGEPASAQEISLDGAAIGGRELKVYYHVRKTAANQSGPAPLGLATVPKAASVKRVNFYQDSVLVKTLAVSID